MTDTAMFEEACEVIRDVLDQPDLALTAATTAAEVPGWDSLTHINIVVAIESRFGVKFRTAEIEELRNVGDLVDLVGKRRVAKV